MHAKNYDGSERQVDVEAEGVMYRLTLRRQRELVTVEIERA